MYPPAGRTRNDARAIDERERWRHAQPPRATNGNEEAVSTGSSDRVRGDAKWRSVVHNVRSCGVVTARRDGHFFQGAVHGYVGIDPESGRRGLAPGRGFRHATAVETDRSPGVPGAVPRQVGVRQTRPAAAIWRRTGRVREDSAIRVRPSRVRVPAAPVHAMRRAQGGVITRGRSRAAVAVGQPGGHGCRRSFSKT